MCIFVSIVFVSVEAVKSKWRGLRDTFRKELQKLPKPRSGQEGGPTKESKWPYFKNMLFLKDQFVGRQLQSSTLEPEVDTQSRNDDQDSDELREGDFAETPDNVIVDQNAAQKAGMEKKSESLDSPARSPEFVPSQSKRVKAVKVNAKSNAIQQLLIIEQEKLKEFKRKGEVCHQAKIQEDGDYHFLMSLLPYLRKVPEDRKLDVRVKLQQVLLDEEKYQRSHYCSNANTYSQQASSLEPFSRASSEETWRHSEHTYSNSSELRIPSGPSSGETCANPQFDEDLASYFSRTNPLNE